MATLLERLSRSSFVRQLEAEEAQTVVDQRAAAVAEIARLEAEGCTTLPPLREAEKAAADQVAKAQLALDQARLRLTDAARARFAENNRLDCLANQQRLTLAQTTPEPVTALIAELLNLQRDAVETAVAASNADRARYISVIQTQRARASALVYSAVSGDDLRLTLEDIRLTAKEADPMLSAAI